MAAIYRATFNSYTELKISVACYKDDDIRYETVDKDGSILITEHELDFYKNFGNGFNKLEFVGHLRPYAKMYEEERCATDPF